MSGVRGDRLGGLWASLPVRLALGAILAVAAYTKIKDPAEVIATVGRAGLTPSPWDKPIAYAIIGTEILIALLLLARRTAPAGALGYAGLSSVFFGYSLWRGWQDIKAPCGCFGLLLRLEPWHGALLSSLMCLAALLALRSLGAARPARPGYGTPTPLGETP